MKIIILISLVLAGCLPDNRNHDHCAPSEESFEFVDIQNINGETFKQAYSIKEGKVFVEGDIVLSEGLKESIIIAGKRWSDNTLVYRISDDLPKKRRVHKAIRAWEKATDGFIKFKKRTDEANFVEFVKKDGCWSYVGMRGGRQEISLDSGCTTRATQHEIGHALGLWHEQSRSDRDEYVEIKWCNIPKDKKYNFRKIENGAIDEGNYDYKSIMHYPRGAFSNNNRITIKSKTDQSVPLFSKRSISNGDLNSILCHYGNTDYCSK